MSKSIESLSAEQADILKEFRDSLSDVLEPHHDDKLLLRFLRARKFDKIKSEAMLRKSLRWRQIIGADVILHYHSCPEVVAKYYPCRYLGLSKEGNSIRIVTYQNQDCKGLSTSVRMSDIIRTLIYFYEHDIAHMKINNQKTGKEAESFIYIVDCTGFSLSKVASKLVMEVCLQTLTVFESNYPETLKVAFFLNVPYYFTLFYNAIKPFMVEETRQKMKFYGKDGWQEDLLKLIDADVLPEYLGGTRVDSVGDPKCLAIIGKGGKVPESYYIQNLPRLSSSSDSKHVIIEYKSIHLIETKIDVENSVLLWEVQTEDSVIGTGLVYLKKLDFSDSKERYPTEELIPIEKCLCQNVPEKGTFYCKKPGIYIIQLDNSFGKYLQKVSVYYKITIFPPAKPGTEFPLPLV